MYPRLALNLASYYLSLPRSGAEYRSLRLLLLSVLEMEPRA